VRDLSYDAAGTALLVVDPYNDFISEGGKLYELARETIISQDCVTHMREVLAAARAADLLVCYAPHHRWRPGDYETWHYTAPTQESVAKNQVFAADSCGGSFHPDFQPACGELVAQEHWLSSGFANRPRPHPQTPRHRARDRDRTAGEHVHRLDGPLGRRAGLRRHARHGRDRGPASTRSWPR